MYIFIYNFGIGTLNKTLIKLLTKELFKNSEYLVKIPDFVLTNIYFGFSGRTLQQISGTVIDTKFVSPCPCIYIDEVENKFLATQELEPLLRQRYIGFLDSRQGKT